MIAGRPEMERHVSGSWPSDCTRTYIKGIPVSKAACSSALLPLLQVHQRAIEKGVYYKDLLQLTLIL